MPSVGVEPEVERLAETRAERSLLAAGGDARRRFVGDSQSTRSPRASPRSGSSSTAPAAELELRSFSHRPASGDPEGCLAVAILAAWTARGRRGPDGRCR